MGSLARDRTIAYRGFIDHRCRWRQKWEWRMGKIEPTTCDARSGGTGEARILRAAERNFARYGLAGATLAQIARDAGMSTAALHYHYRDKETLYQAVLEHILRLWLDETAVIEPGNDPRRALEAYIRAKMRFARIFPDASKVFASEVLGGALRIGPFLADVLRPLVARIRFSPWPTKSNRQSLGGSTGRLCQ
jgi:AcrR family transcriptional regulator